MARCSRCKQDKSEVDFGKDKNRYNGLASYCKPCSKEYDHESYCRNAEYRKSTMRKYRVAIKELVFQAYGGPTCACCGYEGLPFMTIDHIANDGKEHRRALGRQSGNHFYIWLRDNNYPEDFQVLCFSCNTAKYHNGGICPHKENNA